MPIDLTVHTAQVLTAEDYTALQGRKSETEAAQSEAERILAEAHAQAESVQAEAEARAAAIVAEAEEKAAQLETDIRHIADASLERFVDTQVIDHAAEAIRHTLKELQKLRLDYEAFTPWMREFTLATIQKMTQHMPPETVWEGVLNQALMDTKDRWNLVLRCHSSYAKLFNSLVKTSPTLAGHISAVQVDRTLKEEDVHLVTANGVIDVSIPTQVDTVLRVFSEVAE